jgi:methyl-accepting chemotaxis protein
MQINGIVAEIASSAGEQATGLAEVNAAMNQMDQVTQQNAAMVEESTAASQALALEAEGLAALIERFEIGESAGEHPRTEMPARVRAPATPRPASLPRQRGNLALVANNPSENEWEDF